MPISMSWPTSDNRTDKEPTTIYTFTGPATIRASHLESDFLVETATEPHEDGTVRICEALFDGISYVWGESADGTQIWHRENDTVAKAAIKQWLDSGKINEARDFSRNTNKE